MKKLKKQTWSRVGSVAKQNRHERASAKQYQQPTSALALSWPIYLRHASLTSNSNRSFILIQIFVGKNTFQIFHLPETLQVRKASESQRWKRPPLLNAFFHAYLPTPVTGFRSSTIWVLEISEFQSEPEILSDDWVVGFRIADISSIMYRQGKKPRRKKRKRVLRLNQWGRNWSLWKDCPVTCSLLRLLATRMQVVWGMKKGFQ